MPLTSKAKLLFNHVDAWVVSMAIVVVALSVHGRLALSTLPILVAIGLAYWLAFAINDYYDAPSDAMDSRKAAGNYFAQGASSNRWFWVVTAALIIWATLVFSRFGWTGGLIVVVGMFVAWSYSAPPLRLKERPGIDLITHAVFVESFPYAAVLLLLGAAWGALDLFILAVLFLGSLTAQLEQQLRDFDLDKITGNTFATFAGRKLTHTLLVVATVTLVGGAALFYLWGDVPLYLVPFGLIPLPALVHRLIRGPEQPRSPALVGLSVTVGLVYTIWLIANQILLVHSA